MHHHHHGGLMPALIATAMASPIPLATSPPAYRVSEANPPPRYCRASNSSRSTNNPVDSEAQLPSRPPPAYNQAARDCIDGEGIYPARPVFISGLAQPARQSSNQSLIADRVQAENNPDLSAQLNEAQRQPDWNDATRFVQNFNTTHLFRLSARRQVDDEESAPARRRSARPDDRVSGWNLPGQPYSGYVFVGLILLCILLGCVIGAREKAELQGDSGQ